MPGASLISRSPPHVYNLLMESIKAILTRLKGFLETPLFKLGETQITLLSVAYFFLLLILLIYISGKGKNLVNRVLARRGVALGIREATGSIVRYLMLFIGLLVILQTVGIDLTALSILTGAVGLGIGFGLQNIASNFISGIIILLKGPSGLVTASPWGTSKVT